MNNVRLSDFIGHNKIISKNGREACVFISGVHCEYGAIPEINGQIFNVDRERFTICPSDNIERVIFNEPATIVYWKDGTKTIVKCQPGDDYDDEKGLALCIAKKYLGNKSNFNNVFKKYLIRVDDEI